MSKYIIELDENAKKVVAISLEDGIMWTDETEVENLDELNSDYINEHFGQLQDEAYRQGSEELRGALIEILEADTDTRRKYLDYIGIIDILVHHSASKIVEKWQARKKDDEINVGDEVDWSGDKFIVTRIFQPYDKAEECDGVDMDGCTYHDVLISGLTKTGRHVDITDMLKGALG